eukprot:1062878-Pelagomonas_calceolata.AAC.3
MVHVTGPQIHVTWTLQSYPYPYPYIAVIPLEKCSSGGVGLQPEALAGWLLVTCSQPASKIGLLAEKGMKSAFGSWAKLELIGLRLLLLLLLLHARKGSFPNLAVVAPQAP